MKILAFAASNSSASINKKFVSYALSQLEASEKSLLDLNAFPLPIYGVDLEKASGIPQAAQDFIQHINNSDLLLVSLAEHNGSYTSVFKNLFDWLSRHKTKCFEGKKMILLSTSPGGRGGRGVMDAALVRFPIHGAEILGQFCLPNFNVNFDEAEGILDAELNNEFRKLLEVVAKL
jgi:chromate reductase, NAD(P)H dehydrogenase (quinone)